jgi:sugar phosphate isomerase/epimerase
MRKMGISVSVYAVRNVLRDPKIGLPGIIQFLQKNDIKLVEIITLFVRLEELHSFLQPFRDAGIRPIMLTIEGNNFFQRTPKGRQGQMAFMKSWVDAAHKEGITMIRANMGHNLGFFIKTDTLENLVATFNPIMNYIESLGMQFGFENHGGKSADINFQLAVKQAFPSPNFGYILDFGNYNPKSLVYDNILKLGKSIIGIHAKSYDFDANGNEMQLDYQRIIANLKSVGYRGDYSIEYEGTSCNDFDGVEKTITLLRKYL